ncbi:MAG TPA: SDR family NAD(P)-dependent oxidoreductase [Micromonosporaceae bacterium]|nr:SDR family NAD(P)-dependent oxidoreductase [Micromonosporaceae bacterium]
MTDVQPGRVAVVGIGCRLPAAADHRQYYANLLAGHDAIREIGADRWDPAHYYSPDPLAAGRSGSKWCGAIADPYAFDHAFFQMSPREAALTDPQQRLLLQEAWRCVEDSGTALADLRRLRTGVFVGVMGRDHLQQVSAPAAQVHSHSAAGAYDSMLANRVSHALGLSGPSMSVDAACASSLVAVQLGMQALAAGEVDAVLAGGVSLNLHPWKYISFSKARMLSPHGRCRTFDSRADGYVPGDGVAVVMLRRLTDAIRDGDHIYGVIAGVAVNHAGRRRTITAPTTESQRSVVRAAMAHARFDPRSVTYVEAHGTGTPLGDPIEIAALCEAFAAGPVDQPWCTVGSVKPNIGHLEAAAGVAGLIKVLMMLDGRQVPPSIHLDIINPLIALGGTPFAVARQVQRWRAAERGAPLRAGVSSFGMGGVNAHACVEEYQPTRRAGPASALLPAAAVPAATQPAAAPLVASPPAAAAPARLPFVLSARTPAALGRLVRQWRAAGRLDPRVDLASVCRTLTMGREAFGVRFAALVGSAQDVTAALADVEPEALVPVPVRPWWVRVGTACAPTAVDLPAVLSEAPFAPMLAGLAEVADAATGSLLRGLASATPGGHTGLLLTYLALEVVSRAGVQPRGITAAGDGMLAALAFAGAVTLPAALELAGGAEVRAPDLRAPRVALAGPDGHVLRPYALDGAYLRRLTEGARPDDADLTAALQTGAGLIPAQHTFRNNLQEWNTALSECGLAELRIPMAAQELPAACPSRPADRLVWLLAITHAHERLNRKWGLPRSGRVRDPYTAELLDLLVEGVCQPAELVAALTGTPAVVGTAASAMAERAPSVIEDVHRFPLLATHSDAAAQQAWDWVDAQRRPGARPGPAPALHHAIELFTPDETPGTPPAATEGRIAIRDAGDFGVGLLVDVWRLGANVDWTRYWAGRPGGKLSLPTYSFEPTVHRSEPPQPRTSEPRPGTSEPRPGTLETGPHASGLSGGGPSGGGLSGGGPGSPREAEHGEAELVEVSHEWHDGQRLPAGTDPQVTVVFLVEPAAGVAMAVPAALAPAAVAVVGSTGAPAIGLPVRPGVADDVQRVLSTVQDRGSSVDAAVIVAPEATAAPEEAAEPGADLVVDTAFLVAQALLRARRPARLVIAQPGERVPAAVGALSGLAACLPYEGSVTATVLRTGSPATAEAMWHRIAAELRTPVAEHEVRYLADHRQVRRARPAGPWAPAGRSGPTRPSALAGPSDPESTAATAVTVRPGGTYLVTGGAGGLGRIIATHLLRVPDTSVVLAGRSARPDHLVAEVCAAAGADPDRVGYLTADLTHPAAVQALVAHVTRRFGQLHGVVHAAGLTHDRYLAGKSLVEIHAVLAPKVAGTRLLDAATADVPLDWVVLFSSAVAVTGNAGQADYAVANAYLAEFAEARQAKVAAGVRHGVTVTIDWPLWAQGGMTVGDQAVSVFRAGGGLVAMPTARGLTVFDEALTRAGRRTVLYGHRSRIETLLTPPSRELSEPDEADQRPVPTEAATAYLKSVFGALLEIAGQDLDEYAGLDSYGIDSIFIGQFTARLEQDLGPVSHMLLFECRTLAQAAARIANQYPDALRSPAEPPPPAGPPAPAVPASGQAPSMSRSTGPAPSVSRSTGPAATAGPVPVAVIGLAGRYPGADDVATFWRNLSAGRDCVTSIPTGRWEQYRRAPANPGGADGMYCPWGGFLAGVDEFDPLFFQISPRDAELMDPQERLFLQTAWHAFEDAGYPPSRLGDPSHHGGRSVGVFVGVTTQTYLLWGSDLHRSGQDAIPTSTPWSIANRVSYAFDLHGPSMPVDTACASSLTAIHLACASLTAGECRLALAGGVNLYLHPSKYEWLCQMRMLSPTGRCHPFGDGADGFVPGEGVGAVVLKPLADALAHGDKVLGVIRGTATNHGGRTSGFTVPNPNAQARLIEAALRSAGLAASSVTYAEAHGTGTALGDPVEVAGLSGTYGAAATGTAPCAIGSVKANIGHLESAAGIAGVTKVLLQMRHRTLAPSLHAQRLNPRIDLAGTRLRVQREAAAWTPVDRDGQPMPLRAAVSSFGAGGANAHIVIDEPPPAADMGTGQDTEPPSVEHLVPLSARDGQRLREHCANIASHLRADRSVGLADIAYQLQVRREPMQERIAFLVGTVADLVRALSDAAGPDGATGQVRAWRTFRVRKGNADEGRALRDNVDRALREQDLAGLAEAWVAGADVPWQKLHKHPRRHVELPGYPFARERYWLADPPPATEPAGQATEPASHPFVDAVVEPGAHVTTVLRADDPLLADHHVDGVPVFPAVGYLELVRAAIGVRPQPPDRVLVFRNNVWSYPITVPAATQVHVHLEAANGSTAYRVYGLDAGQPVTHAEGRVDIVSAPPPGAAGLAAARRRCPHPLDPVGFYRRIHQLGLQLGPGYQGIRQLWVGDGEAVSEIRLPEQLRPESHDLVLHPAMFDAMLQASLWLVDQRSDQLHLPYMIGSVEIARPTPEHAIAHVRIVSSTGSAHKVAVDVVTPQGAPVLAVRDFWLRPWQPPAAPAHPAGEPALVASAHLAGEPAGATLFRPQWQAVPAVPAQAMGGRLMVRAPDDTTARAIVEAVADLDPAGPVTAPMGSTRDHAVLLASMPAQPLTIVYALPRRGFDGGVEAVDQQLADGPEALLALLQAILADPKKRRVRMLCVFPGAATGQPAYNALGGLLRTAVREARRLSYRVVEVPADADAAALAEVASVELRSCWETDREIRYVDGARQGQRWRRVRFTPAPAPARRRTQPSPVYLITGGLGGLARLVSEHLARTEQARMVLVGRRPGEAAGSVAVIGAVVRAGGAARYVRADIATEAGAAQAVATTLAEYGRLDGVVHCAAVLADDYLVRLDPARLRQVVEPKVLGALHLDQATRHLDLRRFVVFSSVAGAVGTVGQANYAYANAFLDGFASWREGLVGAGERSGTTIAIGWPLWRDGGMSADNEVRSALRSTFDIQPMTTELGLAAFEAILAGPGGPVVVVPGDGHLMQQQLGLLATGGEAATGDEVATDGAVEQARVAGPDLRQAVAAAVAARVGAVVKLDPSRIEDSADIGSYGYDSLSFVRLANELNASLNIDLTPATFFEYTTVAAVTDHLMAEFPDAVAVLLAVPDLAGSATSTPPAAVPGPVVVTEPIVVTEPMDGEDVGAARATSQREPVAIVGMAGMLPEARDLDEFWSNLVGGADAVREIPAGRWDWRRYWGDPHSGPDLTNSRWGGFLPEVDKFDAHFFGISPREAALMDPQQRLFLQTVYAAIEESGYQPADLAAVRTGLYVGVATHDYHELLRGAGIPVEAYTTTGLFHAILANRVSYLLNLSGPSFPIDTACSSSLVAVRSAVEALWAGSCDMAIAGGVNLLLAPMIYISFAKAGMLSPTGRCRTFDASADGYVRGEGVGAIVLKPLSRAVADGDHIHAVIRGSAVNHGGRVSTLTTPNPNAQAELVTRAFREGGVDPASVGYVEMHGTGTALGDPIEVNGLQKAFRDLRDAAGQPRLTGQETVVGSVKSNIGHLEAAAGMAGIFKVILAMKYGLIPANLHLDEVNPHIKLDGGALRLARSHEPWPRQRDGSGCERPRRGGVSSFGFGGVNAHLMLEEYLEAPPAPAPRPGPQVIVLSARSHDRLQVRAQALADHLRGGQPAAGPGQTTDPRIVTVVADLLGVDPAEVPTDESFDDLGLVASDLARLRAAVPRSARELHGAHSVDSLEAALDVGERRGAPGALAASLADIAFTLQVGRDAMARRLAVVTDSADRLIALLDDFVTTGVAGAGAYAGVCGEPDAGPAEPGGLDGLAHRWASGATVDWLVLHSGRRCRRVSLPTYPFARTRHWLPTDEHSEVQAATTAPADGSAQPPATAPAGMNGADAGDTTRMWFGHTDPLVDGHLLQPRRYWAVEPAAVAMQQRLFHLAESQRMRFLLDLVRTKVAAVLGHASPEVVEERRSFHEIGMDSVMALELRNNLGVDTGLQLPSTLIFDYPTPADLADYLRVELSPERTISVDQAAADIDSLKILLSSIEPLSVTTGMRMKIALQLRDLVMSWDSLETAGGENVEARLEAATADEVFDFIDQELGKQ